jgi:SAM-dependent methyltransferase
MDWVQPYYTRAGEYWGPTGPDQTSLNRAATLTRLCGPGPHRVLELGAGSGEAAAAMADAGHSVVAIEFSPTRAEYMRATAEGRFTALEADFYKADLDREFDVVCYWDGFGVGSDADQRRLLKRIADEWLKPGGYALIDVFSPFRWVKENGQVWDLDRNHPSHRYKQRRSFDYDPVNSRFLDTWCPIDDATGEPIDSMAITQKIRCYTPADLDMLLEGTGLKITSLEIAGNAFDRHSLDETSVHPLWSAWSYLALLTAA